MSDAPDRKRRLLFLDLDGVANDHTLLGASGVCSIGREQMRMINWILCETDCRIVLVSAWRYMMFGDQPSMNLKGMWYLLRTHGLYSGPKGETNYLIGCTRQDGRDFGVDDPFERASQVEEWLADFVTAGGEVESYCCLDDLDIGYTAKNLPFVQTWGAVGLTNWQAGRVISILSGSGDAKQQ